MHHYENVERFQISWSPNNVERDFREFGSVPYFAAFSTGERASGASVIEGTWKGKAYGIEGRGVDSIPTIESVPTRLVTADATIRATLRSDYRWIDLDLRNWKGGSGTLADEYTQLNIGSGGNAVGRAERVDFVSPRSDFHGIDANRGGIDYVEVGGNPDPDENRSRRGWQHDRRGARFQFYGPDGAEVAGYWWADWGRFVRRVIDTNLYEYHTVQGGFVAKK